MTERANITKQTVEKLPADSIVWDAKVRGFGARRQKGDGVAYVLFYRTKDGSQRWQTIGKHGSPWTLNLARAEARRILGAGPLWLASIPRARRRKRARPRRSPSSAMTISRRPRLAGF